MLHLHRNDIISCYKIINNKNEPNLYITEPLEVCCLMFMNCSCCLSIILSIPYTCFGLVLLKLKTLLNTRARGNITTISNFILSNHKPKPSDSHSILPWSMLRSHCVLYVTSITLRN